MGIEGIERIEKFRLKESLDNDYDPMIFEEYSNLNQDLFKVSITPQPILEIENISEYNVQEGLARPSWTLYSEIFSISSMG